MTNSVVVVDVKHYRVDAVSAFYRLVPFMVQNKRQVKDMVTGKPDDIVLSRYYRSRTNDFVPDSTGGKTEVTVQNVETGEEFTGVAYCSMTEQFCYKTGRDIALERALQLYAESLE